MSPETQVALILLIVILICAWILFKGDSNSVSVLSESQQRVADNLTKMRRLWVESNYLTRMHTVESLTGYLGANATQERILANANQIGRNLTTMYGQEAGDKLAALLRERHTLVNEITTYARQYKDTSPDITKLKQNNQAIATLLSQVNPNLNKQAIETFLASQSDHLVNKINHTSKHECIASMNSFDSCNKAVQELLDYLDDGVWKHLCGNVPRH